MLYSIIGFEALAIVWILFMFLHSNEVYKTKLKDAEIGIKTLTEQRDTLESRIAQLNQTIESYEVGELKTVFKSDLKKLQDKGKKKGKKHVKKI